MIKNNYQLTSHPSGSVREMWHIAYPLMLALMSGCFMMLADRIYLAHYSLSALNACVNGGMAVWLFMVLPLITAAISEVFVGQYNGSGQYHRMGEPVWQMLWLCIFTIPFFTALSYFAGPYLFNNTGNEVLEIEFFSTLILFAPASCAGPALAGFFIGKGDVKIITFNAIAINLLNICLDGPFIFGWSFIPSMGVAGAALATGLSNVVGVALLLCFFLHKKNRKTYGTSQWAFRPKAFWEGLKIGVPAGLAHVNENAAHFVFFRFIILTGGFGITVVALVQTVYIGVFFILEALSKAVTAITSNLIGAQLWDPIPKVLWSAFKILSVFVVLFATLMIAQPDALFALLISSDDLHLLQNEEFMHLLSNMCLWVSLFFLFDGICWIFIGLLNAAGDTKFVMMVSVLSNWILYVVPSYLILFVLNGTVDQAWMCFALYNMFLSVVYLWRYSTKRWRPDVQHRPDLTASLLQN